MFFQTLLAFFLGLPALAADTCEFTDLFSDIKISAVDLRGGELDAAKETLCKVLRIATFPGPVNLTLQNGGNYYLHGGALFLQPYFKSTGSHYVHDLKDSQIIWSHEYGHAVLSAFIEKSFPQLLPFLKRDVDYQHLVDEMDRARADGPRYQSLKEIWQKFWMPGEASQVQAFNQLFSPYDEFFADLVSVLTFDDRSAMTRALSFPGMGAGVAERYSLRDFSRERSSQGFQVKSPHGLLAPTRGWLGQHLGTPLKLSEKRDLLAKVSQVLLREVETRWKKKLFNLTPAAINQRLIERLAKVLLPTT